MLEQPLSEEYRSIKGDVVVWMSILCGQKATMPNHIHPVPIEGPLLTHNAAVILILLVIL